MITIWSGILHGYGNREFRLCCTTPELSVGKACTGTCIVYQKLFDAFSNVYYSPISNISNINDSKAIINDIIYLVLLATVKK